MDNFWGIILILVLVYFYYDFKKLLTKKDNWIKDPMHAIYTEAEIIDQYNMLQEKMAEVFPVGNKKTPDEILTKRIQSSKNPKEDTSLMYDLKEAVRKSKMMYFFEDRYNYMVQANIDAMNGKYSVKEIEESKDYSKHELVMFYPKEPDITKESEEWIDRILKK